MQRAVNRKSKIDLLPDEIRSQLNALIRSGNMTQTDIRDAVNALIEESGLPREAQISRSSFNRYAKRMENMGARIREAREVSEVWARTLGDKPTSEVGQLLQEFIRTLAFETSTHLMETSEESKEPVPPKELAQLALVAQRVEQASHINIKNEKEIRAAFAAEAAEKAEKIVKQAGITEETAQVIKNKILGIA